MLGGTAYLAILCLLIGSQDRIQSLALFRSLSFSPFLPHTRVLSGETGCKGAKSVYEKGWGLRPVSVPCASPLCLCGNAQALNHSGLACCLMLKCFLTLYYEVLWHSHLWNRNQFLVPVSTWSDQHVDTEIQQISVISPVPFSSNQVDNFSPIHRL